MPEPRAQARFPSIARARGHYESFYLRAGHPREPLAVWIRYTVHKAPGAAALGSLWFTLFEPAAGPPRASKITTGDLGAERPFVRVGDARFGPDGVRGAARTDACDASWALRLEGAERPFRHLPRVWLYRAPLPRTKLESPWPAATFHGTVTVDGRTLELDGWRGMVGHNWGAEHAERWIWLHASGLGDEPDGWLDLAVGRVRIGRFTTPWVANGGLSLGGRRRRLGGPGALRSTVVGERPDGCTIELPGLRAVASAPVDGSVAWLYADPGGGQHNTINCSVARVELSLAAGGGAPPRELRSEAGAAYELGLRETDHGIPLQPFADP